MATQVIERLIDDLDGDDAAETVRFGYDGVDYTIDLSTKNAAKLRKQLAPYVDHSVKIRAGRPRPGQPAPEDTPAGRARIRAWARRTGKYPALASRGRLPREVVADWYAAGQNR